MAAGVNYNNVWACLGQPVSVFRYTGRRLPHRRLRRVGHRRGGRARRDALEGGRRGRRPLQPELRRVPGVQRARPDGLLAAEDLGLRDELGLVRRLLPRAGPAAAAEAAAPDLGGGGVVRPRLLHRLPHARRPGGPGGRPQRARLGRRRRSRLDGDPALPALRRERDRGRLERGQGRSLPPPRRARGHQPARLRAHRRRRRAEPRRGQALRQGGARGHGRRRLRHRVRARRLGDVLHERLRLPHVRQDRHVRRDVGLLADVRRALPVDAPEDDHRLALRQRLPGLPRQPADRASARSCPCSRARSRSRSAPSRTR